MNIEVTHIGIGFVTGRRHFQNVLTTHINSWLEHGLIEDKRLRLHLFIAYDLAYQNTEIKDYKNIDPTLKQMIDSITFIGKETTDREIAALTSSGEISPKEATLIFGDGYAKKRNTVLYHAIKRKMDKLIFLDDDEYPMAVFKNDNNFVSWMGQSIVGSHIKYNDEADITHGYHCGYISPIPSVSFTKTLTETDFKRFIETISNDIISWENVKTNIIRNNGVTYARESIIKNEEIAEVAEVNGMKFISGANICFNLQDQEKILPPFFNPPGARGEDTFMSTCLTDLKVLKIPCYAFHDGFSSYNNLLNGVLPLNFTPASNSSPEIIKRFIRATIGWIRYKPLLLYITQRDNYEHIIREMKLSLELTVPKLCAYFNTREFEQLYNELRHYDKNVKKHFAAFQNTKKAWTKIIEQTRQKFSLKINNTPKQLAV